MIFLCGFDFFFLVLGAIVAGVLGMCEKARLVFLHVSMTLIEEDG